MSAATGVRIIALMLVAACGGRTDEPAAGARAAFIDTDGKSLGSAVLHEGSNGVLIRTTVSDLPNGIHGFHIHTVGKCEPPFDGAGGHFNPLARKHGTLNPEGPHAGDLPNMTVAGGKASFETIAQGVTLASLFDADSSALVIHANQDDYRTDPSGNAGARIACAVIRRP